MVECPGASVPEIVFAGRSNAGKSTAINTLCKQRQLAYASKMPGRTQLLNFFHVIEQAEPIARLVDLPGYGFAQLAQTSQSVWDKELGSYLAERPSLVGTVLIVDCRRGLLELDYALIKWVGASPVAGAHPSVQGRQIQPSRAGACLAFHTKSPRSVSGKWP